MCQGGLVRNVIPKVIYYINRYLFYWYSLVSELKFGCLFLRVGTLCMDILMSFLCLILVHVGYRSIFSGMGI